MAGCNNLLAEMLAVRLLRFSTPSEVDGNAELSNLRLTKVPDDGQSTYILLKLLPVTRTENSAKDEAAKDT